MLALQLNPAMDLSRLKASDASADAIASAPVTGAELYAASCASCHQGTGQGRHPVFPPLAPSEWVTGDARTLVALTLHGATGPMRVNDVAYSGLMPSFAHMSDEELALVLTHIRTSWGNAASPLTAAEVTQVRDATSGRDTPWTADELRQIQSKGGAP